MLIEWEFQRRRTSKCRRIFESKQRTTSNDKQAHNWLPSLGQLSFYVSKMVKFWFVEGFFSDSLLASLTKLVAAAELENHV